MANRRPAGTGFLIAAALFAVTAFLPLSDGGRMNVTFFSLAVVFGVLGAAASRRR